MLMCWAFGGAEVGPGVSGELPEPDEDEEIEAERLRKLELIVIGSESFTPSFRSILFIMGKYYGRVNFRVLKEGG